MIRSEIRGALFGTLAIVFVFGLAQINILGNFGKNGTQNQQATVTTLAQPAQQTVEQRKKKTEEAVLKKTEERRIKINEASSLSALTQAQISEFNLTKKPEQKERLKSVLILRKAAMLELAQTDPGAFLALTLPKKERDKIPADLKSEVEAEVKTSGTLEVLHVDDFDNPANSELRYTLRKQNGEKNRLYPATPMLASPGTILTASGYSLNNAIVSTTIIESPAVPGLPPGAPGYVPPPLKSVGEQKTIVFLVNFQNSNPPPFTATTAHDLIFNDQFNNFIKETSYNKAWFTGNVHGWVTIPRSVTSNESTCGLIDLNTPEILNYIRNNNIDLAQYRRVFFILDNQFLSGGCSSVGTGPVTVSSRNYNLSVMWIGLVNYNLTSGWLEQDVSGPINSTPPTLPLKWSNLDFLLAHEGGHSLGLWHANSFDCGEESYRPSGTGCVHWEYGNPFDAMGNGYGYALQYNAYFKEILGWLDSNSIQKIDQSGLYSLKSLEENSLGYKGAKIRLLGTTQYPYYLEYRKPLGFDVGLSLPSANLNTKGLLVNRTGKIDSEGSRLLDMSPIPNYDYYFDRRQSALVSGKVFSDPDAGISIGPIISTATSGILYNIQLNQVPCTRRQLEITDLISSNNMYAYPGYSSIYGQIYFSFKNNDSSTCGASKFKLANIISPFLYINNLVNNETLPVMPETLSYNTLDFFAPLETLPGTYSVTFDIVNIQSGQKLSVVESLTIKASPSIDYFSPTKGPIGTDVTIYGHNFSSSSTFVHITSALGDYQNINPSIIDGATSTIYFKIPDTLINGFGGGMGAPTLQSIDTPTVPTSPGLYSIFVISDNFWTFTNNQFEVTPSLPPLLISCNGVQHNSAIVWTASAGGGAPPYNFIWSGAEGVTGTNATIVTPYQTSGLKTATVDVSSGNNERLTASCSVSFVVPTATSTPTGK